LVGETISRGARSAPTRASSAAPTTTPSTSRASRRRRWCWSHTSAASAKRDRESRRRPSDGLGAVGRVEQRATRRHRSAGVTAGYPSLTRPTLAAQLAQPQAAQTRRRGFG